MLATILENEQRRDLSRDYRIGALFSLIPAVGGQFLDLGSGNGEIANFLRGKYTHITLSDNSDILFNYLKDKFRSRADVSVEKIDINTFSFGMTSFDCITCSDVLEHLPNDRPALKNIFRSLKSGGLLFLTVPAMPKLFGRRDRAGGHYQRYSKKSLKKMVEMEGFVIKHLTYWNMIGTIPYVVSEKILHKELRGPARQVSGVWSNLLNRFLYLILWFLKF